MRFCTLGWCDNEHYARGMCHPHYDRWRRTGERGGWIDSWTMANPRPLRTCSIEECARRHYAKGLCAMHYARVRYCGVAGGPDDKRRTHVVEHGTLNEYNNFGCRCELCREANTQYMREYRLRKAAA